MSKISITAGRRQPKQERSIFLFETIVSAATRVFGHSGYDEASTVKIAEKAGVSVGSLYSYFPNKEVLVNFVTSKIVDHHLQSLEKRIHEVEEKTAENILDAATGMICDLYLSHRRLMKTLFERTDRRSALPVIHAAREKAIQLLLKELPRQSLREPENAELSLRIMMHAVLGLLEACILDEKTRDLQEQIKRQASLLTSRFLLP